MPDPTPFTNIDVINQALGAGLGEEHIVDLTGTDKATLVMVTNYNAVKYDCMTRTNWRALTADASLSLLSGTPISRWSHAWQMPSDCLKVISTWPISSYEIRNRQLLTNEGTRVELVYIRNLEEAYWPAWFTRLVVAELTIRVCRGITGNMPDAEMRAELARAESQALFQDAQQQPNQTVQSNAWIDCRY